MNEPGEHWRLFIAIESPPEVQAALRRAQQPLRRSVAEPGVRWTSEEQFHLTLRFLGNVETTSVRSLSSSLAEACSDFGALQLRAEGIGFFPSTRKPRVVWAGVSDKDGRLREFQKIISEATGKFGSEEPENDFHGHITLGRIKNLSRGEAARLVKAAEPLNETVFGEWKANRVQLIRSELSSSGPVHTSIAEPSLV